MPRRRYELVDLLEREIRKVLIDSQATRADKLKAIDAGAKIAMVKHRIQEATDGAAGSFFAREPAVRSRPERALQRPAAGAATGTTGADTPTNGAGTGSAAPGSATEATPADPPADPPGVI